MKNHVIKVVNLIRTTFYLHHLRPVSWQRHRDRKSNLIKRNLPTFIFSLIILFFLIPTSRGQEDYKEKHYNSLYAELFGGGLLLSGNYELRLQKGINEGFGFRIGIGGGSIDYFGKSKVFSIPVELNYAFGKRYFSGEVGLAMIYAKCSNEEDWLFQTSHFETDKVLLTYIPFGLRIKPPVPKNGVILRLNIGPMINYSSPNEWSDNRVDLFFGLALGYSFHL